MRALVLGSFPSVASLEAGEYYAHPQNWFWRVLEHCGVIAGAAAPYPERVQQLRRIGLGVWDLYAEVRREGSGDDRIRDAAANRIDLLQRDRGPCPILLNGRRRREWNRRFKAVQAPIVPLPSTSPRPLHWNSEASRAAALAEWCTALREALGRNTLDG